MKKHIVKHFKQIKDSKVFSQFKAMLLLSIIIIFLFNFNTDSFTARGQLVQVEGEGIVGYLVRWLTAVVPDVPLSSTLGLGHPGFIPKWAVSASLWCSENRVSITAAVTASQISIYTGDSAMITWTSESATSCTGTNFSTAGALTNADGVPVTPNSTTTYTITCTASGGETTTSSVTVTVKKKPKFIEI